MGRAEARRQGGVEPSPAGLGLCHRLGIAHISLSLWFGEAEIHGASILTGLKPEKEELRDAHFLLAFFVFCVLMTSYQKLHPVTVPQSQKLRMPCPAPDSTLLWYLGP